MVAMAIVVLDLAALVELVALVQLLVAMALAVKINRVFLVEQAEQVVLDIMVMVMEVLEGKEETQVLEAVNQDFLVVVVL